MRKVLVRAVVLVATSVALVSCSSSPSTSSSGTSSKPSGLKVRAFVSNPLEPTGTGTFTQVLNIVDATLDELSPSVVSLTGTSQSPGFMSLSPDKIHLLVFSSAANSITVVDTTTESIGSGSSGTVSAIKLPDATPSMLVAADNVTGYAAVPAAPVTTSPPALGAVEVFGVNTGTITSTIPVPGAHFVAASPNGNRILALGTNTCVDNTTSVTLIAPSLIGSSQDPRTVVCGFDHPAWAVFSSDNTFAYVLNCGPECGGSVASVSRVDLSANPPTITVTLPLPNAGATFGLLSGSTLYVAGTPPGTGCGSGTAAPACGTLETVDVGSMTVTSGPVLITDGVHNHMEMGANGQLFIGATTCSSVDTSSEVRGCLTIFDTTKSVVVIPPVPGDVTGIAPITNRNVVYVCQNANFQVYDTTTDKLATPIVAGQNPIVIAGQPTDVKLVD